MVVLSFVTTRMLFSLPNSYHDVSMQVVDGHKTKISGWIKLGSGKGSARDHIRAQSDLYAAFVFLRQFVGEPAPDDVRWTS